MISRRENPDRDRGFTTDRQALVLSEESAIRLAIRLAVRSRRAARLNHYVVQGARKSGSLNEVMPIAFSSIATGRVETLAVATCVYLEPNDCGPRGRPQNKERHQCGNSG